MWKIRRFQGFTRTEKLYVGTMFLLAILVVSWLQSYSIKGTRTDDYKWSPDGDRIPLRAIERIANKRFVAWAANPVVIEAVQEANKKPAKSLDEIIQLDQRWIEEKVRQEWINELLNSQCSRYLRKVQAGKGGEKDLYGEIFVMDRQGCIVAMSGKTSDYWQGDEDKFIKSYADGEGAIFINKVGYDRSIQVFSLLQVSVPVLDPDTGKAVGAITVGLDLDVFAGQ